MDEIEVWELDGITEYLDFPFLRKLKVSHRNPFDPQSSFETNVVCVVRSSPALRSFTIDSFGGIVQDVLRQVVDHSSMLEELDLCCKFLVEDLCYLLNKCSALTKLSLQNTGDLGRPPVAGNFWDSDNWECLRPYGHVIHKLGLHGNSPAIADFLSACPRLHALSCMNCDDSTLNGMVLLRATQSCPLLEDMQVDLYASDALLEISRNCKKLRKITFLELDCLLLISRSSTITSRIWKS